MNDKLINKYLVYAVENRPKLYYLQFRRCEKKEKDELFEAVALEINEQLNINTMTGPKVKKRWVNLRKSFVRALSHNSTTFYLFNDMVFLKPHIVTQGNEELDDEEVEEEKKCVDLQGLLEEDHYDEQNLSFSDIEKSVNFDNSSKVNGANVAMKASSSNLHKHKSTNDTDVEPKPKKKIVEKNYFSHLYPENGTLDSSSQNLSNSDQLISVKKELITPPLDKFAHKKMDKIDVIEKKILQAVDANIIIAEKIKEKCSQNEDDEYESTIREAMRSIPAEKLLEFVTMIHSIIKSCIGDN